MLALDALGNYVQKRRRLGTGHALAEPGDGRVGQVACRRLEADGYVGLRVEKLGKSIKAARCDAGDGDTAAIHAGLLANDRSVSTEAREPVVVPQNDYRRAAVGKEAAQSGLYAHQREKVATDVTDVGDARLAGGSNARLLESDPRQALENRTALLAQRAEDFRLCLRRLALQMDRNVSELSGRVHRKLAKEEVVGDTENYCVGADAESEG